MSQNSADSSNGNNSKNIPTVVNNHADRLMDELFADIEELLSGDLSDQQKGQPAAMKAGQHSVQPSSQPAVAKAPSEPLPEYPQPVPIPAPVAIDPPKSGGGWKKIVAGLGLTALVAGGGAWWLAKEGKINLGAGLSNNISTADIKFADYLSKALNKIDSTSSPVASSIAIPNPPSAVDQTAPTVPGIAASPNQAVGNSFTKIIAINPPTVEFIVNGATLQVKAGEQIGNSGWVLTNTINQVENEVIVKRNGELRSLKAGQPF